MLFYIISITKIITCEAQYISNITKCVHHNWSKSEMTNVDNIRLNILLKNIKGHHTLEC